MRQYLLLMALALPFAAITQQNKKATDNVWLQTIGSAAIVGGQSGVKPVFQLVSGIRKSIYFAGIGVGYDNYLYKSLPVFADMRIDFSKKQIVFAYGDLGYNIPVGLKTSTDVFKTTDLYYGGIYIDAGLGYRHKINNKNNFLFSFGYTLKDINKKEGYTYPCINPPCTENISYYKYRMGRVVTRVSWEFGWTK